MDWLTVRHFVVALVLCFGLGFLLPLVLPRGIRKWRKMDIALGLALLGSLVALGGAAWFWGHPSTRGEPLLHLPALAHDLPALSLDLYMDRLAAFFVGLTGLFSALVALYSLDWLQDVAEPERHRVPMVYNLLVLSTLLTVLANNVYFFLCFLEVMTLAFSYLVLYRHNRQPGRDGDKTGAGVAEIEGGRRAFRTYLIFSHVGLTFLTAGLIALSVLAKGSFNFDDFRNPSFSATPAGLRSLIFVLVLIGLGIKAGIAPMHVWVPVVHPHSPTSIHAMMSSVILKVAGIYGLIRVFFEFLRPVPWWWGWTVLLLAGLTAVVGVFYALVSPDLKSALASHSVENIGIILAGIGLALLFSSADFGRHGLAGLALIASLYHVLNHAVFKGLLFLCTAAIENRTGTVRLDELGGLTKYYRWTSAAFLVGSLSIAGFPPFNGFVSEWLTLQALFAGLGGFATRQGLLLLLGLILALLLLSSAFGLTALAFVKIAGETVLGAPRQPERMAKAQVGDVPWRMRGVLAFLAVLCLLLGLFPGVVIGSLQGLVSDLGLPSEAVAPALANEVALSVPVANVAGKPQEPYTAVLSERLLFALLAILVLPVGWVLFWRAKTKPVWTGGVPYVAGKMQLSGSVFASSIWQPFARKAPGAWERVSVRGAELLPTRLSLSGSRRITEVFRWGYNLALDWLLTLSGRVGDWFQDGDIRRYLLYIFGIFITVLAVLMVLAVRGM